MAIRRLDKGNKFSRNNRAAATVSTLPTVTAMRSAFESYLSLTIADGHASEDTIKTYRARVGRFLDWCKERELYPALIIQENVKEYRKYLIDESKGCATIRLSLLAIKHFYVACQRAKLIRENPTIGVRAPRDKREIGSTLNFLSQEELQELIAHILPMRKIGSENSAYYQFRVYLVVL